MLERLSNHPQNYPARVDKLTDDQMVTRSTWAGMKDIGLTDAAKHVIHVVPADGTTITLLNPLDPGTIDEKSGEGRNWLDRPTHWGDNFRHGKVGL